MRYHVNRTIPVYTIGVVEEMTGLTGRRIRYYEQVGLISPARTKGNQRLYSQADVDRLKRIKELLDQGLNLEGVKAMLSLEERDDLQVKKEEKEREQWSAHVDPEGPEPLNPRESIERQLIRQSLSHPLRSHLRWQRTWHGDKDLTTP